MRYNRIAFVFAAVVLLAGTSALMARQGVLSNGSMEFGPGPGGLDPMVAADWTEFGENVERSGEANLVPSGAGHALKAFGDPATTNAGAYQDVPAGGGDQVTVSASLFTLASDKLDGSGHAGVRVEFLGQFGNLLSWDETTPFDSTATADTWTPVSLGPLTAPAGTYNVRLYCILKWSPPNITGSVYWDNAQVVVEGDDDVLNGDFETAGTSGQTPYGIDDWNGFNDQEQSENVADHGTKSLRVGTLEPYSGLYQMMTDLVDGERILLVARGLVSSTDVPNAESRGGIKLEFHPTATVPPPEQNLAFSESSPADTWQQVTLSTTVPPDVTIARVVLLWGGNAQSSGSVRFDLASAEINTSGVNELLRRRRRRSAGTRLLDRVPRRGRLLCREELQRGLRAGRRLHHAGHR